MPASKNKTTVSFAEKHSQIIAEVARTVVPETTVFTAKLNLMSAGYE